MFQSLNFFVFSCLFFAAEFQTRQIPPPQNVSLIWINDFQVQLSWAPPEHLDNLENCSYDVVLDGDIDSAESPFRKFVTMNGSSLNMSVETVCKDGSSKPVHISIVYPDLVSSVRCSIRSSIHAHCSWLPANHAPALSFFYWFVKEDSSTSVGDDVFFPSSLKECPSYTSNGTIRTGCDLQADMTQDIHILFNGTWDNKLVRNTFKRTFTARLPPLKWEVTKTGGKFIISWSPPDIKGLSKWKYTINYTECNEEKVKTVDSGNSTELDLVPHCPYSIYVRATIGSKAETEWGDKKYFDAEPNALVYAFLIIPLMFAGLALFACVCYRKNKHNIFPKIPGPRDLLSDISDNNNKSTVRNLYIPAVEEDNCKITLVVDPQNNKVNS